MTEMPKLLTGISARAATHSAASSWAWPVFNTIAESDGGGMSKINCNAYVLEIDLARNPPTGLYEPPVVTLLLETTSLRAAVRSDDIDDVNEALRAAMGRGGYVTLTIESCRDGRGEVVGCAEATEQ